MEIPQPLARIDVVQTGPEEPTTELMRELPTPAEGSTLEPVTFFTPRPLTSLCPSFISELERITKSPFKTPGTVPSGRLSVLIPTPKAPARTQEANQNLPIAEERVEKELM